MTAYVIGQLNITDPEAYKTYLAGFMPIFERHEGKLLATSSQKTEVVEGSWATPATVLMSFPSLEAAHAWHNDPDYQELAKIRHATAETNLVIVEGL